MELLNTIINFIIAIFILVTVHEFGHFITARMFGMRVDRFFIGFDFWGITLWKKKIGETEYGIGAFPVGGYVKIAGMIDESLDTEYVNHKVEPWEFRGKPVWQRLIVMAGGVFMNMVLATIIFIGITATFGESRTPLTTLAYVEPNSVFSSMGLKTGDRLRSINGAKLKNWEDAYDPELLSASTVRYTVEREGKELTFTAPKNLLSSINDKQIPPLRPINPPVIEQVMPNDPADKAGILPGSLIVAIDGVQIIDWDDMVEIISKNAGKKLAVTWMHLKSATDLPLTADLIRKNGQTFITDITPNSSGKIGISSRQTVESERIRLSFPQAVVSGLMQTKKATVMTVQGFAKIFTGKEDFRKSVGGPIKIARIANQSAEQGPVSFMYFVAVLSISLAFINILPVPALDGGQFLLNAIEGIIGREIPFEIKMRIQQVGMTILLMLFAYFMVNDLLNF
ncbi:MAG: RIP metalloprotease RseP [Chlorobaculum sp.]|jgi:regulator of sigma E protease|nr:RIP metalloprotease RseP [Chlorobaculum sp.]